MDIISELNGKRILIWGYGREGKATEHFLALYCFEGMQQQTCVTAWKYWTALS